MVVRPAAVVKHTPPQGGHDVDVTGGAVVGGVLVLGVLVIVAGGLVVSGEDSYLSMEGESRTGGRRYTKSTARFCRCTGCLRRWTYRATYGARGLRAYPRAATSRASWNGGGACSAASIGRTGATECAGGGDSGRCGEAQAATDRERGTALAGRAVIIQILAGTRRGAGHGRICCSWRQHGASS